MPMPRGHRQPIEARLAKKSVRTQTGCLAFHGSPTKDGYGRLNIDGRMVHAARIVWGAEHGPILPGLRVCHSCDYPPCIYLAHLFLGTPAQNTADARAKGRLAVGERCNSRLTAEDVVRIRELAKHETYEAVAYCFGVTKGHVGRLVRGVYWRHLPR